MIKHIRLNNFRSYRSLELPLGNLNVLIGRNGSGKSNLLDYEHSCMLHLHWRRTIG
jgi:AAA15 family ATPase/GTPase